MPKDEIRIEGTDRLVALLQQDEWYGRPVKRALARIGQLGKTAARVAAPRDTGHLASHITYRVNTKKKQPRFVAISTRAYRMTGRGAPYPYPRTLEFSPKHHHRGWMRRAIESIQGSLASFVEDAIRDIEQAWKVAR